MQDCVSITYAIIPMLASVVMLACWGDIHVHTMYQMTEQALYKTTTLYNTSVRLYKPLFGAIWSVPFVGYYKPL